MHVYCLLLYISFLYNQLTRFVGFLPKKTRRIPDHTLTITHKIVWYTNMYYKKFPLSNNKKATEEKKLSFFYLQPRLYWQWVITTFYLNKNSFSSFLCLTQSKKVSLTFTLLCFSFFAHLTYGLNDDDGRIPFALRVHMRWDDVCFP